MIVVDTGPLVAMANEQDGHHARCVNWFDDAPRPLLIPAPVLTEVCYLLERERGAAVEAAFLRSVRDELAEVATLDRRHFTVVRPSHVDAFTLLP